MNSKKNTLTKVGYDYGDTEWGTGDGWGYSSSVIFNNPIFRKYF